jgi:tetratricopeptide (TPR) repeat protein
MKQLLIGLIILFFYGCSSSSVQEVKEEASNKEEQSLQNENNPDAMTSFLNGTDADAKGDYPAAILEYTDALQIDPKPGIYYCLAKDYYFLNKLSLALQNVKKAIELENNNIEYYQLQADIYSAAKQNDEAIESLEKIISIDSSDVSAYYQLARIYEGDKPLKAIEVYNKLTKIIGSNWEVLIRVADLYEKLGLMDKAISTIEELLTIDPTNIPLKKYLIEFYTKNKDYNKALDCVNDIIQFYPDDIDAHEKKAEIYIAQNDWLSASKEYDYILQQPGVTFDEKIRIGTAYFAASLKDSTLLPEAKELFERIDKDTTAWETKMFLGTIALRENKDSVAEKDFNKVVELAPWNPQGWIRLGGLLFDNKKYKDAEKILLKGVDKFPEEFAINLILGLSYSQLDDHENAKIYLSKAVELNPEDATALSALGYTLSQLGDNDKAIFYIKKALQNNSKDVSLLGTLGLIYDNEESWKECDSIYTLALQIDSLEPTINNNFAYSYSKRGVKLDEALRMVSLALEKEPDNASFLDTKGWVYFKMDNYEKAKEFIQKALDIGGDRSVILEHLGDILFKMGNKDEAIKTWKKALELDKNNSALKTKIEKGEI